MIIFVRSAIAVIVSVAAIGACFAAETNYAGLFDVQSRRSHLQDAPYASLRQACLAVNADAAWLDMPVITGLTSTDGYGTDRSANEFNWAVMVLGGRALAGDASGADMLKRLLLKWSSANAFADTELQHDAYYALKRSLLPLAVSFSIIRSGLTDAEEQQLVAWVDPLIRRVDHQFGGDVDYNNHRDLADSAIMVWGAIIGDEVLLAKGRERYLAALSQARADGSMPLETRRGARALWYTRQLLSSLTVMAEVGLGQGEDLYAARIGQTSLWTLFGFLVNGLDNPVLVNAYAGQNYIPGPIVDFRLQDIGFAEPRGNGRHYLAFMEAIAAREPGGLGQRRAVAALFSDMAVASRPLIDEFSGGNATCFWGQPS